MSQSLGLKEIRQMEAEGWTFSDAALRVGNGWLMWCQDTQGNLKLQLLADPTDEPQKFLPLPSPGDGCVDAQLAIALEPSTSDA
jgi:hypothetical protein